LFASSVLAPARAENGVDRVSITYGERLPSTLAASRMTVDGIFRFPSAVKRDPAIDAWLDAQRDDLRPLAKTWFAFMRQRGRDVRELMHDGCPTACVDDAAFGYVNAFSDHVNVGFFFGALLEDPGHLLEGTGKRGRHVKLKPGRDVNSAALTQLVDAAYADIRARLRK
jgi:hypothetical protein